LVAGRRRKVAYGAAPVADKMHFGKNGSCAMVSCSECKLKKMFNVETGINSVSGYRNYGVVHPRYICDRDDGCM
jgi:hypothetical protein